MSAPFLLLERRRVQRRSGSVLRCWPAAGSGTCATSWRPATRSLVEGGRAAAAGRPEQGLGGRPQFLRSSLPATAGSERLVRARVEQATGSASCGRLSCSRRRGHHSSPAAGPAGLEGDRPRRTGLIPVPYLLDGTSAEGHPPEPRSVSRRASATYCRRLPLPWCWCHCWQASGHGAEGRPRCCSSHCWSRATVRRAVAPGVCPGGSRRRSGRALHAAVACRTGHASTRRAIFARRLCSRGGSRAAPGRRLVPAALLSQPSLRRQRLQVGGS